MDLERYLDRIGYRGSRDPTAETLAGLQRAHLMTVPFESLDAYLGRTVVVDRDRTLAKIVDEGRGGFCFELNGAFSWLLERLGFDVTLLAARPIIGSDELAPPFAHLALLVRLERRWLVDVGFGYSFIEPLLLDEREEQERDGRRYRVEERADGLWMLDLTGDPPGGYRFDLTPRALEDFAGMCHTYSTDPDSPFVRRASYSMPTLDGWTTVTRARLIRERAGVTTETPVADDDEWRALLFRHFGVRL